MNQKKITTYIKEVFPYLLKFFQAWFLPEQDEDRDGLPQWKHILQTGFEDNPLFDAWHEWSLGVNITHVHSPAARSDVVSTKPPASSKWRNSLNKTTYWHCFTSKPPFWRKSIESTMAGADGFVFIIATAETGSSLAGKLLVKQTGSGTIARQVKVRGAEFAC